MASLRSTVRIARPADDVWRVVSDADVLEDGPQGALVVYSTEITTDELAGMVGPSIEGGVQGLKQHLEGS